MKLGFVLQALGVLNGALALSLSDVCTTSYVQSVLPADAIEGVAISSDSVTCNVVSNYSITASDLFPGKDGLDFCNVTFSYTHTGLDDTVNVWYWLPSPDQFQGRYVSTGGGGWAITSGEAGLGAGLVYGAVTGTTDGGFGSWKGEVTDVILTANGTMNYTILNNFGYLSIHEMTVLGKEFTKQFYSAADIYSYYQGCSEGGREGWSQVQRYGSQFDGAAIGAPAFRQAFQQVNHLYAALVEVTRGYAPPPCELEQILNDTIAACDPLDGRTDGVVSRSDLCKLHHFANASIGNAYNCSATMGGPPGSASTPASSGTVTALGAAVAQDIWDGLHDSQGRQVYVDFLPAAEFADAATVYNSTTGEYEVSTSGMAAIGSQFVNMFINKEDTSDFSFDNVTYDTLRGWMLQAMQEYEATLQTNWPDLEDVKAANGKIIHIHGESDPSIPPSSSVIYHDSVRKIMYPDDSFNDGYDKMNDWYRFYLVPGAAHCARNAYQPGPFPVNWLESLIDWVENNVTPTTLNATTPTGAEEQLCAFPRRPNWTDNTTMECVYDRESVNAFLPALNSIPMPV